mgnify:CR=1 FL=1
MLLRPLFGEELGRRDSLVAGLDLCRLPASTAAVVVLVTSAEHADDRVSGYFANVPHAQRGQLLSIQNEWSIALSEVQLCDEGWPSTGFLALCVGLAVARHFGARVTAYGFGACEPCGAGTFSEQDGSTRCDACQLGGYCESEGQASALMAWTPCEAGTIVGQAEHERGHLTSM